jgi:YD repeat-containing protein
VVAYPINVATPGAYTLWLRGYPTNAAGDSAYVGLDEQTVEVTGFAPGEWSWASEAANGETATLAIATTGVYTLNLFMREDGLRIDRLLLTTDTNTIPDGLGPPESARLFGVLTPGVLTRTIVYTYDNLYRLTAADYSTGEFFDYTYDDRGNRLSQTTLAGTTVYTYDAANRLTQVDGQAYTWDNNGNLLSDGPRTFTYDSENRLASVVEGGTTTSFSYNGDGDRYAQTIGGVTTDYVLDPVGLAQVLVETTTGQDMIYLPAWLNMMGAIGNTLLRTAWAACANWLIPPGPWCWARPLIHSAMCWSRPVRGRVSLASPANRPTRRGWFSCEPGTMIPAWGGS